MYHHLKKEKHLQWLVHLRPQNSGRKMCFALSLGLKMKRSRGKDLAIFQGCGMDKRAYAVALGIS